MKEIRGAKLAPQPTNSQRIREMDTELKNLQMAGRINQMMIQQLLQNVQNLGQDLGKAYGVVNELQYKVLAMQELGEFKLEDIKQVADKMRLADFEEASNAEDAKEGFTVGETVQDDSTVIITSTTAAADAGIFRSRVKLADCGVPALIEELKGKPVGTKVVCQLNGVEHTVELLGIRNPSPAMSVVPDGDPQISEDGMSSEQRYKRVPTLELV